MGFSRLTFRSRSRAGWCVSANSCDLTARSRTCASSRMLALTCRAPNDAYRARRAHALVHVVEGSLHEVGPAHVRQELQRARLRRRRENASRREPTPDTLGSATSAAPARAAAAA